MNNVIISHPLAAASIILLVICILPRRKPVTRSAMIAHALCGIALAVPCSMACLPMTPLPC